MITSLTNCFSLDFIDMTLKSFDVAYIEVPVKGSVDYSLVPTDS